MQPDLPRARLRAEEVFLAQIEGILHIAGGVIGGRIERREVVVVVLDLGAFKDLEAHAREDIDELVLDARHGVERPLSLPLARHGDVERLAFQPRRKFALLDARLRRRKVSFQLFADGVHLLAEGRALLGRDLLHLLQQRRDDARTAQKLPS